MSNAPHVSPEERARRSARMKALHADPAFQAKRRHGIAERKKRMAVLPVRETKPCKKCGEVKPREQFYKHTGFMDGRHSACKSCMSIEAAAYRQRNREKCATWGRKSRSNPERREYVNRKNREWRENNQEKIRAHQRLNWMVKKGSIVRGPCARMEQGGCSGPVHGHHEDYSKPLEVVWLCMSHHRRHHSEIRKEAM